MDEEKIPSVFNTDGINLGYLDPSSQSDDLTSGTQVDLPFWLARSLADPSPQRNFVNIQIPKHYNERFQDHLVANAGNFFL